MDFLLFKMLARVGLIGFDPRMGFFPWGSAGGKTSYKVQRSVRLRGSATPYFQRDIATTGDTRTFFRRYLVKRGRLGNGSLDAGIGGCRQDSNNHTGITFRADDRIQIFQLNGGTTVLSKITTRVFRDPAAWLDILVVFDTTNSTVEDKVRLYVNGERITSFDANTVPAGSFTTYFNEAGRREYVGTHQTSNSFDGCMAECYGGDGITALPSALAEQDAATRMWVPKKYTGTYGTNGFYLDFSNITSTTTLGYDKSGNNNHWTAINISLTAGATYDSMLDVPGLPWADGGNGRGNYCTIDWINSFNLGGVTIGQGNLDFALDRATYNNWVRGNIAIPSTGKWYFELIPTGVNAISGSLPYIGVGLISSATTRSSVINGGNATVRSYNTGTGDKLTATNGTMTGAAYGPTTALNNVVRIAVDMDAGKFYAGNSTGWFASGDPVAGTNAAFTDLLSAGVEWMPVAASQGQNINYGSFNFGQRPFAYTPPTGFKALHTGNLPTPTGAAAKPWEHFDAALWAGNGSSRSITGIGFQPGLVWAKARSSALSNLLFDEVRGATKYLQSDRTSGEGAGADSLTSFNADGFSLGADTSTTGVNQNSTTYAGWLWKAGGAAVTNTAGSRTSQVSANTAAGFSIATFNAGAAGNITVGHGLGVKPDLIILRQYDNTCNWFVWHKSLPNQATDYLYLNTSASYGTNSRYWANTAPTSSVLSIESGYLVTTNTLCVAYCATEIPGFSKIGSYIGNGSADGPFVYCGFRPRWILIKRTDSTQNWSIIDTARDTYNVANRRLFSNFNYAEDQGIPNFIDITANGFKCRDGNVGHNANGGSYIFYAIAEAPFQFANAR